MSICKQERKSLNILVTAIGSVSSETVCSILKESNYTVFGCDVYPKEWLEQASYYDDFFQVPYVDDREEYLKCILHICKTNNINFIIPLIDVEVDFYNDYRAEFKKNNIIIGISSKRAVSLARDKNRMMKFIEHECENVKPIPTVKMSSISLTGNDFPLVCKPNDGRSSQGMVIIETKGQLLELKKLKIHQNYIVEPYIMGDRIVVDVVRQAETNHIVAIPRKELISTPHGCGISVYVYNDLKLEDECKKIAEKLGINGCVNFEFIKSKESEYYFLECNPRFSAGIAFTCLSGYDVVNNHVRCFFDGHDIENKGEVQNQYVARGYRERVTKKEN